MHTDSPPSIIGISGKQFAGKDTLADLLLAQLPDFQKIPLARAIKQTYAKQTGLSLEAIEQNKSQHRPELIKLGDWRRAQDPDYWIHQVLNLPGNKIISDVRLLREYQLLKEKGAFLIRVDASREIRAQRGTLVREEDATECELDNITEWDLIIENQGDITTLSAQIGTIVESLDSPAYDCG